jgi:hypothetical protein
MGRRIGGGSKARGTRKPKPHRNPHGKGSKGNRSTGIQREPCLPISWFKLKKEGRRSNGLKP